MASAPEFKWSDEYNASLEKIADTDEVDIEWTRLKVIIKHKLTETIASFLVDSQKLKDTFDNAPYFSEEPSTAGGLKIAPFPPRISNEPGPIDIPKLFPSEAETVEVKNGIFAQLDTFDDAPFSIQRLAELCVRPREHYKALGKYLRAVERVIYVTSTWKSFPPLPPQPSPVIALGLTSLTPSNSIPSTPLYSPIPFLHEDARRSKSRSPPPSPFVLASDVAGGVPLDGRERVLGLVDELDDPGPGHLSDHPTAISSVTNTEIPGIFSLDARFVKETRSDGSKETEGINEQQAKKVKTDDVKGEEKLAESEEHEDKENKT